MPTGLAFGMGCNCCGGTACSPCALPDSGITCSVDISTTVTFALSKASGTLRINNTSGTMTQQGSPYWFFLEKDLGGYYPLYDAYAICNGSSIYCLIVNRWPTAYASFSQSGGDITFSINQTNAYCAPFYPFTSVTCSPLNVYALYPSNGMGMASNCQLTE